MVCMTISGSCAHRLILRRAQAGINPAPTLFPTAGFVVALLAVLLSAPTLAWAHNGLPSRQVVVQFDTDGAAALWHVEMTGEPAALLWAMHDLDHNGQLSQQEEGMLALALLGKIMGGVQLTGPQGAWQVKKLTPQLVGASSRKIELYVLAELDTDAMKRTKWLRMTLTPLAAPVQVRVRAQGQWQLAGCQGPRGDMPMAACGRDVTLAPGEFWQVGVQG